MNSLNSLIFKDTYNQETSEKTQKQSQKTKVELEFNQEKLNSLDSESFRKLKWSTVLAWATFLTGNYPLIIGASLLAYLLSLITEGQLKELKKEEQVKSLQRVEIILEKFRHNHPTLLEIEGIFLDERFKQIDYLLYPNNEQTFALSITTLLPDNKGFVQVSDEKKKPNLIEQKSPPKRHQKKPNYFLSDSLKQLTQDLEYIKKSQPAFTNNVLTGILILANPITLATLEDTDYQQLGTERYLYINGIYVVEESRLLTLLTSLISSELTSSKLTISSSKKEVQLSKPPIRLLKKPFTQTLTATQETTTSLSKSTSDSQALSEVEQDDLIRQKFPHIVEYIAFFSEFYLLFFRESHRKISLFALYFLRTTYGKTQIHKTGRILSLAIREETEYRLSSLLIEKLSYPGMTLYTHWDYPDNDKSEQNSSKMPDMILHIPPNLVFIISVKSLISTKDKPVKVFYDSAVDTIRFRKGSRGKQGFSVDPIVESHQRVNWLLEHHQALVPHQPIQIVVFANPIEMKYHPQTPVQFLGKRKFFMHHKEVYVIKENKLVSLIKFLCPKTTMVNN